jgi:hypothetical protein
MMRQSSLLAAGLQRPAIIAFGLAGGGALPLEWLAGQGVVHAPRAEGGR